MKRKALGKGLSALLPEADSAGQAVEGSEVEVSLLDANPFQPRGAIAEARLDELAASIRESGMVQPILVRPMGERYQIVAGERRFRAALKLGLSRVPVVVRDVPDEQLLELALVENIQREELTPLEEAHAFRRLLEEFHMTQEEIARKVGRDRSTVTNTLRLLRLPKEARELLSEGRIDAGHARALLALEGSDHQIALAREVARRGLSVREVERRVALARGPQGGRAVRRDPNTRAAEERLRSALGTKVDIRRRGKGGVVRIAFKSETELQRLFDVLVRAGRGRGGA
ncbi:MAG TPA: ParB/RepB/Spo0J family partition protein [Vicinamibacteria bacterium]|jgi:ParB family chromosome partitioning protein